MRTILKVSYRCYFLRSGLDRSLPELEFAWLSEVHSFFRPRRYLGRSPAYSLCLQLQWSSRMWRLHSRFVKIVPQQGQSFASVVVTGVANVVRRAISRETLCRWPVQHGNIFRVSISTGRCQQCRIRAMSDKILLRIVSAYTHVSSLIVTPSPDIVVNRSLSSTYDCWLVGELPRAIVSRAARARCVRASSCVIWSCSWGEISWGGCGGSTWLPESTHWCVHPLPVTEQSLRIELTISSFEMPGLNNRMLPVWVIPINLNIYFLMTVTDYGRL
jgi:hypothetical protein